MITQFSTGFGSGVVAGAPCNDSSQRTGCNSDPSGMSFPKTLFENVVSAIEIMTWL